MPNGATFEVKMTVMPCSVKHIPYTTRIDNHLSLQKLDADETQFFSKKGERYLPLPEDTATLGMNTANIPKDMQVCRWCGVLYFCGNLANWQL